MKKTVAVLIALVMVLGLLAGCAGTPAAPANPSSPSEPSKPSEPSAPSTPSEPSAPTGEVVEIAIWHQYGDDASVGKPHYYYTEWANKFNAEHSDIHVTVTAAKSATDTLTAVSGGTVPDIFMNQWNNAPTWAAQGALLDLTPYYEKDTEWNYKDFMPGALAISYYNGKFYSVPNSYSTTLMFYNEDILKAAGFSSFPKTTDEMLDAIRKTTKVTDGEIECLGFLPTMPWFDVVMWPASFGIQWISDDGKTVQAEKAIPMLEYIRSINELYIKEFGLTQAELDAYAMDVTTRRGSAQDPVLTGEVAMRFNSEGLASVIPTLGVDTNWKMAPFPNAPGAGSMMMLTANVWQINAKTEHPDAAWTVLASLTSAENQKFMARGEGENGYYYARRSCLEYMRDSLADELGAAKDDANVGKQVTANIKTVVDLMLNGNMQSFPCCGCVNELIGILDTNCKAVINEGKDPAEMMKAVNAEIQPLLDADPYIPYKG